MKCPKEANVQKRKQRSGRQGLGEEGQDCPWAQVSSAGETFECDHAHDPEFAQRHGTVHFGQVN